jgi:hypothetical protein
MTKSQVKVLAFIVSLAATALAYCHIEISKDYVANLAIYLVLAAALDGFLTLALTRVFDL